MDTQYPRVNGTMMQQYLGRSVALIGEVVSSTVDSGKATIRTSDGMMVTAFLPPGSVCEEQFMELLGKVVADGTSIEVRRLIPIVGAIDLDMYNKVLELSNNNKFKSLFV